MAFCFDEFNLYPGFVVAAVATIGVASFMRLSRFLEGKTG